MSLKRSSSPDVILNGTALNENILKTNLNFLNEIIPVREQIFIVSLTYDLS